MKKLLAIILAIICILSFASCKNEETKDTSGTNVQNEENIIENEEQLPEENGEEDESDESETPKEKPAEKPVEKPQEKPQEKPSEEAPKTIGNTLLADFKAKASGGNALSVAEAVIANPIIQFAGATMPVEPGFLNGFDNEITGFSEGAMFGPMIGSIPFIGYVFTLEDGQDVSSFISTLKANANLRWNICTEADEMVVGSSGNKVFFVMCPKNFEE